MKGHFWIIAISLFIYFPGFAQAVPDTICLLQLNDVYEIGALNRGTAGGMARVATLVKQHKARYQTFVVLAGDFVSPSVIGTTTIDSQKVNGRQMVDIMNKTGVDLVTFGNHEFDIPENDLQKRINESHFAWVSSDVLHRSASGALLPFYRTKPDSAALPASFLLTSVHGQFTIGIITATIQSNPQPWVEYSDHLPAIKKAWDEASKQAEITLGLTHLSLKEDTALLHELKYIPLIMGGHEHQHNYVATGGGVVAKADANAKTIYRHFIFRDSGVGKLRIISELIPVDSTVTPDPLVAAAVKEWEDKAYASFRAVGLDPDAVIYQTKEPLDGTEASVRYKQTNLGNLIAASIHATSPQADCAVFNSGSIRIDDMIEGVITQLDIIRTLPFGGKIYEVKLSGELLNQMLDTSNNIKGLGGYLQVSRQVSFNGTSWLLNGKRIDPSKTYTIVSLEYLISGKEKGLEFLKDNPGIKSIKKFETPGDIHADLRLAVVKYFKGLEGKKSNK